MLNVEAPKINRELYRRYQRGGLSKEELANFCYSLAQTTLNEELARREAEAQKKMEKFLFDTNRLLRAGLCLILHDKKGYGKKRLTEVLVCFNDLLDSYAKGYLDIDDMEKTVEEECGIKFNNRKDEENELSE